MLPINNLGSIPKRDRPRGNYVYLHRKSSIVGEIFYVGKGSGKRAWALYRRVNPHWNNVAKRHGVFVDILKDNLTKEEALELEVSTIKNIGLENLTNVSTGGESGRAGITAWNRVKVRCSNGMAFDSATAASYWLRENGWGNATGSAIIACCKGVYKSAYGHSWSYVDKTPSKFLSSSDQRKKKVYCSNGMIFDSQKEAADWVSEKLNMDAKSSNINACLSGRQNFAFGLHWSYTKEGLEHYRERRNSPKSIYCSNGMLFKTISDASRWLIKMGQTSARPGGIVDVLKGRRKSAYGFNWAYEKDGVPNHAQRSNPPRKVLCGNGMTFEKIVDSEMWLRGNGFPSASASRISNAARGKTKTAYGLTWEYQPFNSEAAAST